MLKAFDDINMSKSKYIKDKNLIITASRGRRVKVALIIFSFGKFPAPGGTPWRKSRNSGKYRYAERWRICTRSDRL
jgi:hypothetical protein